ncbi:Uncharacterized protein FKW44_019174 [Caligus rogercresseyi]|uniref:UFSP2 second domain-containing protein n=1 Tax=Caligus rogercresseyi TaxID=217165 RepID=A0A7T8GVI8_CALRO|nr:Uncharacterized protein FKW44_019174 [Caligus rogercresseyi]
MDINHASIIPYPTFRLPDQFLSVNNPVVFIRRGSEPLQAFISSNLLEPSPLSIRKDFEDILLRVRVRGSLQIMCTADEEDITNSFRHLINKVTCPYGSFRLTNSNVLFLHYWRNGVLSTDQGWTVNSSDFFSTEEDGEEEGVKVTNVKDVESKEVTELWKYVQNQEGADFEESDGDDGDEYIPEALKAKAKKKKNAKKETAGNSKPVKEEEFMNFKLMLNMSGEAYTLKTYNCSPIVREDPTVTKCFKLDLPIDSIGVLRRSTKIPDIITVLKGCVQRQIHMIGTVVLSEFRSFQTLSNPEIYHFKTMSWDAT